MNINDKKIDNKLHFDTNDTIDGKVSEMHSGLIKFLSVSIKICKTLKDSISNLKPNFIT